MNLKEIQLLKKAYMSVYEDFESEAYVPLHRGEDEAGPIPTRSWSKKMSRALVNVGKEKFKGRMGGETNIARGVAAKRKLDAMKAVDAESESERRKKSEAKSTANKELGQRRRSLETQMNRQHLEKSFNKEDLNVFDILISHLLDEGYADDVKNAYCILENMSEDWVLEILDEAEAKWGKQPMPSGKMRKKEKELIAKNRNPELSGKEIWKNYQRFTTIGDTRRRRGRV